MSSYEKYVNSEIGRTFLISGLLALILGYLTIIIPLADTVSTDPWYSFLYNDVTIAEEDRFNAFLVILETLFLYYFISSLQSPWRVIKKLMIKFHHGGNYFMLDL